jgi:HEAT repeat protein
MTDEELGGIAGQESSEGLSRDAMNIMTSLHASMVNYRLYPPSSDIVVSSVVKALEELRGAIERWGPITFSNVESKLLINDFKPEDREQAKANVVSFLKDISLWDIRSITFTADVNEDEFRAFMEIFSRKRTDKTIQEHLHTQLEEAGVRGIMVDEKIYVSLGKDQDPENLKAAGGGGGLEEPVDMLKDEIFVRYLTGRIHLPEVSGEDTNQILSDPGKINRAFHAVLDYAENAAEPGVDVHKAGIIKDTVDRMYTLLSGIEDEALRNTLDEEMVSILSTLDPGVLVDVLTEDKPEALKDPELRREVVHNVEGENIPALTDKVIEKYQALIEGKDAMSPEDFADISAVMNELIDELYSESDFTYHPVITEKLRESGLLDYLMGSHPDAGTEIDVYGAITDIRTSGSLRVLEGRSDVQIALIVRKLLQLHEDDKAYQIINVASRNMGGQEPENRLRAIRVLEEIYDRLREAGLQASVDDKISLVLECLEAEDDATNLEVCCRFAGKIANDLFLEREMDQFYLVTSTLLRVLDADDWRSPYARQAFTQLHIRDVGQPLVGLLFNEKEENRSFAARLVLLMDQSMFLHTLITLLKEDEPRTVYPELARVVQEMGKEVVAGLAQELDKDNLEDVYIRILTLLEMVGGNEAVNAVKHLTSNPIPPLRARAFRTLAKIGEGDHALLPLYMEALNDSEVEVRRAAVRGLGSIYDERAIDTLIGILHGKSPHGKEDYRVEEAACLALTRLGSEKGAAAMLDLLKKKMITVKRRPIHPVVKATCCYGLSQLGGHESVALVRALVDDEDPVVRNEATKAMRVFRQRGLI